MPDIPTKATPLYRLCAKAQSAIGYGREYGGVIARGRGTPSAEETELNARLSGYPRNHNYRIAGGRLVPSFRLYERARLVRSVLPGPLNSFLDIGCCRGFYVLDASVQPSCRVAVGVDVHRPFVDIAQAAAKQMGANNTAFHVATLEQLATEPSVYQGPYQAILLIGTYHYMFWGSDDYCGVSYRSHREILARLARLSAGRVILSGRLELERLPRGIRAAAMASSEAGDYNTAAFVAAARAFFEVRLAGFLGAYPLLALDKK